jgi:hypothetical protein
VDWLTFGPGRPAAFARKDDLRSFLNLRPLDFYLLTKHNICMSFYEILLVLLIAILLLKPEDIPLVAKKFIQSKNYIFSIKEEIATAIHKEVYSEIEGDVADMNKYLEKIIEIEGKYDGDYDLISVKKKYTTLLKNSKNV